MQLNLRVDPSIAELFRKACKAHSLTQAQGFEQAVNGGAGDFETLEQRIERLEKSISHNKGGQ